VKDYLAILERASDGTWSAYVPDLPGCTSFGSTREEAARNVGEAVAGHIAALRETGQPVPEPSSLPEVVHIA
jgi:predicted RNase H-like HicB family nuclease